MSADGDIVRLRATAPTTEYSIQFIQGMIDRVGVSYYKYGRASENFPELHDALASMQKRLDLYRETKNTEFLIDAANFLMLEFMFPSLAEAHYQATDSDASPGVVKR